MRKLLVLGAAIFALASPVNAQVVVPPTCFGGPALCPSPHTAVIGSGGAAATVGFLGFVSALALYDIQRRWTCSGDYLHLGGPGFSTPTNLATTVKPPPNCAKH